MPDFIDNYVHQQVAIRCSTGEQVTIGNKNFYISGLVVQIGKENYYIGLEYDIKADDQAVTLYYGTNRKEQLRIYLARTVYGTIADLKTALISCKVAAAVSSVVTTLPSGQLVVTVDGISSDPLTLPFGGPSYTNYSPGTDSHVWATGGGVTFVKVPANNEYILTIPEDIELGYFTVIGTAADAGGAGSDIYIQFNHDGTRTFNLDKDSAKIPWVFIHNAHGDWIGGSPVISRATPAMGNPNLLSGVSAIGNGDIELVIQNAASFFPTFKLTFIMP